MTKKLTTITELAAEAGVNPATVSKALSGTGKLKPETRARIRELAARHNFQINRTAQSLKLGRHNAIAVVLPLGHESAQSISDPFFITMIGHLADELSARKQELVLSKVVPRDDDWIDALARSGRSDGLIIIGQSDQHQRLNEVAAHYQPIVVWGQQQGDDQRYCSVGSDNFAGGELATTHLIKTGKRKIAFAGMTDIPEIAARYEGYRVALKKANLKPGPHIESHLTPEGAYGAFTEFLKTGEEIDAVFAASDVIALNAMHALDETGLSVPDDVAVVGFDDVGLAPYARPPLTTVRQDLAFGAKLLVDRLFELIEDKDAPSVSLPPKLIRRGSA